MTTFEAIRSFSPDFFVNSDDVIYADNPIASELRLGDGTVWKNVTTEGKAKVAESLDEFRSNYRYNMMDANVRRLNAEVPSFVQWDDHETLNNWYPTEQLQDDRYTVKSVSLLSARAKQAFLDYLPIHASNDGLSRIYRTIPYGPLLEVFFIDLRSYRGVKSSAVTCRSSCWFEMEWTTSRMAQTGMVQPSVANWRSPTCFDSSKPTRSETQFG